MLRKKFDIDLDNVDANGIAESQNPSSGGDLTLNGALGTTLDFARRIGITSDADDLGRTFTITGTDSDGKTLTEDVTGPNAGTSTSTEYFTTISSISIDAASAGNITVGTVDEAKTKTYPLDRISDSGASIAVTVTGTIDFTVQETFDDVQADSQSALYIDTSLADKTASITGTASVGASALQLVVNSYTDTAELQWQIAQPRR